VHRNQLRVTIKKTSQEKLRAVVATARKGGPPKRAPLTDPIMQDGVERLKALKIWDKKLVQRYLREGTNPGLLADRAELFVQANVPITLKCLRRRQSYIETAVERRKREVVAQGELDRRGFVRPTRMRRKASNIHARIERIEAATNERFGRRHRNLLNAPPTEFERRIERFERIRDAKAELERKGMKVPKRIMHRGKADRILKCVLAVEAATGQPFNEGWNLVLRPQEFIAERIEVLVQRRKTREAAIRTLRRWGLLDNLTVQKMLREWSFPETIVQNARYFVGRHVPVVVSVLDSEAQSRETAERLAPAYRKRRKAEKELEKRGSEMPGYIKNRRDPETILERIETIEKATEKPFDEQWWWINLGENAFQRRVEIEKQRIRSEQMLERVLRTRALSLPRWAREKHFSPETLIAKILEYELVTGEQFPGTFVSMNRGPEGWQKFLRRKTEKSALAKTTFRCTVRKLDYDKMESLESITEGELSELVRRAKFSIKNIREEAFQKLANMYYPWIRNTAAGLVAKYRPPHMKFDELAHIGRMGLFMAVENAASLDEFKDSAGRMIKGVMMKEMFGTMPKERSLTLAEIIKFGLDELMPIGED